MQLSEYIDTSSEAAVPDPLHWVVHVTAASASTVQHTTIDIETS